MQDEISIHPDTLPNYEQKIKSFYEEHLHTDEEIRFVLEGSGARRLAPGWNRKVQLGALWAGTGWDSWPPGSWDAGGGCSTEVACAANGAGLRPRACACWPAPGALRSAAGRSPVF